MPATEPISPDSADINPYELVAAALLHARAQGDAAAEARLLALTDEDLADLMEPDEEAPAG